MKLTRGLKGSKSVCMLLGIHLFCIIKLLLYLKNEVMQSFHFIAVKISGSYHVVHGSQERFRVNSLQEMLNKQCFTRKKSIIYSFIIQKLK